jgi:ribose transport system ATP-binding protein
MRIATEIIKMHSSQKKMSDKPTSHLVEMQNIVKSFGSSVVLDNVSLSLMPGSVHALMGENGAGKSTLMRILAGVIEPTRGAIRLRSQEVRIRTPKEALSFGISTVFQELSLLPNLSIAENMFLGKEPLTNLGTIDTKRMQAITAETLKELNLYLDPATLVSELTIAERQFVEIARGISANASVIVLDEPTAALNAADVEILNRHIQNLKNQGKAIVYISHRMDEIFNICDTVTVLKDGRNVGTCPIAEVTPQSLIAMMVGRNIEDLFPARSLSTTLSVLDIHNFQLTPTAKPISLSLQKGEIVGLAGLEGQGQRELLRSLIGQYNPHAGTVTIKGKSLTLPISPSKGVRLLQALGLGFVPEDRKDEGLFLDLSIAHNVAIALHTARTELSWAQSYQKVIVKTMSSMAIKAQSPASNIRPLSGGNQQKVLLGRYLASNVDILLIEEPTRGVDIGAKTEIYKLLRSFTNNGGAILVLSRETLELIGLCDRLFVIHNKTIVKEMPAREATEHKILDAALAA